MKVLLPRLGCLLLGLAAASRLPAAPPAALAAALESLRDQKSYSWQIINGDPGPVAQNFETRRGTVTTVMQNISPTIKGSIDLNGDTLIQREWTDGLKLETFITASGAVLTNTPEGWLTNQEILTAQAEERLRGGAPTPRAIWLRRADRPDVRRPDEELAPLLKAPVEFETVDSSTFIVRRDVKPATSAKNDDDDVAAEFSVTITLRLRNGAVRDYEVEVVGSRRDLRSRVKVPVNDHRIVILTHVPMARVNVPAEARERLKTAKSSTR
jgi:hypothetical protein